VTPESGQFILVRPDETQLIGRWELTPDSDDVAVELRGQNYTIKCDRDLPSAVYWFVRNLETKVIREPLELQACMNCQHFQLSGMAMDMGRGHIGVCLHHEIGARTLHCCDDFKPKQNAVES
jgi:hypothetical protein